MNSLYAGMLRVMNWLKEHLVHPNPYQTTPDQNDNKEYKLQYAAFKVQFWTLIGVGLYVIFTGYQSCKMRQATNAAKESADAAKQSGDVAVASVRPWMAPDQIFPPPPSQLKLGAALPLWFTNAGKLPAIGPITTEDLIYWDDWQHKAAPEIKACPIEKTGYITGTVNAGGHLGAPPINRSFTKEEITNLKEGTAALVIHMCVSYGTVVGKDGLTDYCTVVYKRIDNGLTEPCPGKPTTMK